MNITLTITAVAGGFYSVQASDGRKGDIVRLKDSYSGRVRERWFVTYPGERRADDVFDTLRDAKLAVAEWIQDQNGMGGQA